MVGPLGGAEHHEDEGAVGDAEGAPAGSGEGAADFAVAEEDDRHHDEAEEHGEDGEAAGHGPVNGLDGEPEVAEDFAVPRHVGADFAADAGGFHDGANVVVAEDAGEDGEAGGADGADLGGEANVGAAFADDVEEGPDGDGEGGDCHEAGGVAGEGEGGGEDGGGGGQHPVGGDALFEQCPGEDGHHGDERFGPHAVVEGHVEHEEDAGGGPGGDLAGVEAFTEAGDDGLGDEHPGDDGADEGGKPHEGAGGVGGGEALQDVVVGGAEGGFGDAVPAVVVGHVAGILVGYSHHGVDVAVVGGVGADEVPDDEEGVDDGIEGGEAAPVAADGAVSADVACGGEGGGLDDRIDAGQGDPAEDHTEYAEDHGEEFHQGGFGGEAGVDVDGDLHVLDGCLRGVQGKVGEDAHGDGAEVGVVGGVGDGCAEAGDGGAGTVLVYVNVDGAVVGGFDV